MEAILSLLMKITYSHFVVVRIKVHAIAVLVSRLCLGVAQDDHVRGGSAYLHKTLQVDNSVEMSPCSNAKAVSNEKNCKKSSEHPKHIVIISGIGVTAFLPAICEWEDRGVHYQIHYAVRSREEAAFLEQLPSARTILYTDSRTERLDVNAIIPEPGPLCSVRQELTRCSEYRRIRCPVPGARQGERGPRSRQYDVPARTQARPQTPFARA